MGVLGAILILAFTVSQVQAMAPLEPIGYCNHGSVAANEDAFPCCSGCSGSCSRSFEGALGSWGSGPECEKADGCWEGSTLWWYAFAVCSRCHCTCYQACRDGVWTDWTPWSQCTEQCGNAGTRERSRDCVGRVSLTYGADCPGVGFEQEGCMAEDCQTVQCDLLAVSVAAGRIPCESGPSNEDDCLTKGCCWDAAGAPPCYSPPGHHEWSANNSDWRYIKHLDAPTIWQYVNLTVQHDRNLWVALTATWGETVTDTNSYRVQFNADDAFNVCVYDTAGGSNCAGASQPPYHSWGNVWVAWIGDTITAGYGGFSTSGVASIAGTGLAVTSLAVRTVAGHAMIDANPVGFETHWCWPGKSLQPAYTCECSTGWRIADGEAKCLLQDTLPSLETCRMTVSSTATGGVAQTVLGTESTACEFEGDYYMNFEPTSIDTDYEFVYNIEGFVVPGAADYPDWISAWGYGITKAIMTKRIYDLDHTTIVADVEVQDLGPASRCAVGGTARVISIDAPHQDLAMAVCDVVDTYPAGQVHAADGQKYCHHLKLAASTMFEFNTWDGTTKRRYGEEYLDEPFVERELCFLADYSRPIHCTDPDSLVACTADDSPDPCWIVNRRTTEATVTINMLGWHDPIPTGGTAANTATIEKYILQVYQVATGLPSLPLPSELIETIEQAEPITSVTFPDDRKPNAYDLHFTVKDKALNHRECRALVIHDVDSVLTTDPANQMNVVGGVPETEYVWQTNNGPVTWRWDGFFLNDWIAVHDILRPHTMDDTRWGALYSQYDGWVPETGTHHIRGVIVGNSYRADDEDYIPGPTEYINDTLAIFDAERWQYVDSCTDGEKYIMWKRVYDYREQELIEFCNIYIDATPPNLNVMGVNYNGENELRGIPKKNFVTDMIFDFIAYDDHSNIYDIRWWFGITEDGAELGEGAEAVVKYAKDEPCPDAATCTCPMIGVCQEIYYELDLNSLVADNKHIGQHNELYHLKMIIRNEARLETLQKVTILVDLSDPVPGHIYDGPPGTEMEEVDYRADQVADAHILGAYDHESGVRLYRFAIAEDCLEQEAFLSLDEAAYPDTIFINTTDSFFTGVDTGMDAWKVSAIVMNNVMEPSAVICSDGVRVDSTGPHTTEILVRGASVKQGIGCYNDSAWMIWSNRTKQSIPEGYACDDLCSGEDMPDLVTMRTVPGNLTDRADDLCGTYPLYVEAGLSLMRDTVQLDWEFIEEESQLNQYKIGISQDAANTAAPDLVGYTPTHSKHHVTLRDAAFSHGSTIAIQLKAQNKAAMESVVTIAPVFIDETAPEIGGDPTITVTTATVCVEWTEAETFDDESGIMGFSIAIGTISDPEEMQSFTEYERMTHCGSVWGVEIPTLDIQIHDGEARKNYVVTAKIYNGAGMFTLWPSPEFQVPSMYLTSMGVLKDVDPDKRDDVFVGDIDHTFNADELCFRRAGFNHPSSEITFELGVGTTDSTADVIDFAVVSNVDETYCLAIPGGMTHLQQYFGILKATTDSGQIQQNSDGIYYIDSATELATAQVHDGEGCFAARAVHSSTPGSLAPGGVITEDLTLMLGQWYTLELIVEDSATIPELEDVPDIAVSFDGADPATTPTSQIFHEPDGKRHVYSSIFARQATSTVTVTNNLGGAINVESLLLKLCEFDAGYQRSTSTADVWWNFYFETEIREHITSYEVALEEAPSVEGDPGTIVAGWESGFLQSHYKFLLIDLLPGVRYTTLVRACFASICMPEVRSDGFLTAPTAGLPGQLNASAVLTYPDPDNPREATLDLSIAWDAFAFDQASPPTVFYAWTVSTTSHVSNDIHDWTPYEGTEPYEVLHTIREHVLWEQELYVVLHGTTEAGLSSHVTALITINQQLDHFGTGRYVYEVPPDTDLDQIIPFLNSSDIGSLVEWVHSIEADYQQSMETMAVFVTGSEHFEFKFRLVTDKSVTYENCFDRDVRCAGYVTTNKNYHVFYDLERSAPMEQGARFFTCVEAASVTIIREPFDLEDVIPAIDLCSDGITIDTTPPIAGEVYFGYADREFQTEHTQLYVHWENFMDLDESTILHTNGIANYEVSVGTFPGAEDIIKRRSLGRVTHKVFSDLNIVSGMTLYAKVEAYDQVGLSTAVISAPLAIDSSPPDAADAFVNVGSFFQSRRGVQCSQFEVHWAGFSDVHSATLKYQIAVGSAVGAQDKLAFEDVQASFTILDGDSMGLQNGQSYSVAIKAINSGSLATVKSSSMFVCDDTAPVQGWVWDGHISDVDDPEFPEDIDYKRDLNDISFRWGGFQDPESGIEYYEVGLGTEPGMTDVWPMEHVSTNTYLKRHLHMRVGQWFYATVRACNQVGLCHQVHSDGILYDDSPPIVGNVYVGFNELGVHDNYIPSPSTIAGHTIGFHDSQSGIRNFEFAVGTSPGDTDVMDWTTIHKSVVFSKSGEGVDLPCGPLLYLAMRVWNNVDLSATKVSNPFQCDETPPEFTVQPAFDMTGVGMMPDKQLDRSQVRVTWRVQDVESRIRLQSVSVWTNINGHMPVEDMELETDSRLALPLQLKDELSDGSLYQAQVAACNGAGHCSVASIGPLLVDSSRPILGELFEPYPIAGGDYDYDTWLSLDPMTWTSSGSASTVTMFLSGFSDPHSGLHAYYVKFGSDYGGGDLMATEEVVVTTDITEHTFDVPAALPYDGLLYVTIWVKNNVGQLSHTSHISFHVHPSDLSNTAGVLREEKHHCTIHSCNEDCTCAPLGEKCYHEVHAETCVEVSTTDAAPFVVTVNDGWSDADETTTGNANCLRSWWTVTNPDNDPILRYEWTFGLKIDGGESVPGDGIFDLINERIWYDVNELTWAVHCMEPGERLEHFATYLSYVKVWYTEHEFTIFASDGILVDLLVPQIRIGAVVTDKSAADGTEDLDFTTVGDQLHCDWDNIFNEAQSEMRISEFSIGTSPGADDTVNVVEEDTGAALPTLQTHSATGLTLISGQTYTATVRGYNIVGFGTRLTSDGITIDNEPPICGVVYNGNSPYHVDWQPSTEVVEAHWFGFDDHATYILRYEWAIGIDGDLESVQAFTDVSIMISGKAEGLSLEIGVEYFITVRAWDASGFSCNYTSLPFQVDDTPPEPVTCPDDDVPVDIVNEPAFDGADWTLKVGDITASTAPAGDSTHNMRGEIWRNVTIEKHQIYSFTMFTSTPCTSGYSRIKVDYAEVLLDLIPTLQNDCEFYYRFVSKRDSNSSIFSISSIEGLNIKSILLTKCSVDPVPTENPIFIQMIGATDVEVQWYIDDRESNIRYYEFALGTTPGGAQLSTFRNFGIQNTAYLFNLPVSHNVSVYAMVIAHNRAGLEVKFISEAAVVDWTPPYMPVPIVAIFPDGGEGTYIVQATWYEAEDPESGIAFQACSWSIGTSPGLQDLQDWTVVEELSGGSESLALTDGQYIYATAQCRNGLLLSAFATSLPTRVAASAPNVSAAMFEVMVLSRSGYRARDGFTWLNTEVHVFFEGIVDIVGIRYYEVRLSMGGSDIVPWTRIERQTDVTLPGLTLAAGQYVFSVRALSLSGLMSDEASVPVTVTDQTPEDSGNFGPAAFVNDSHIELSWERAFEAQSGEILYDVNVGVADNAAGVVSGLRTFNVTHTFSRQKIQRGGEFHVLVRAVNAAGDYSIKKDDITAN